MEGKQPRPTPAASKTPPYVTARPEVTCLPLKGPAAEEGELRFVVLATDGRASLLLLIPTSPRAGAWPHD